MNYLLMSGQGLGLGLALRLKQEGAKVAVWIKDGRFKPNYDGLLLKTKHWEDHLDNASVLFDSTGGGRTADRLRSRGHRVLSGGNYADQLETDREVAADLLQQGGVKLAGGKAVPTVSVSGWFDSVTGWFGSFVYSLCLRKAMNGDLGAVGLTASVAWSVAADDVLLDDVVRKLTPALHQRNYTGPLSLELVVSDDDTRVTNVLPRYRESTLPLLFELAEGPKAAILTGTGLRSGFAAGLVVSIPPYPYDKGSADKGVEINGFTRDDREHLYFHDVQLNKDNQLVSTSASGKLVTVTGFGDSIKQAFEPVYELAERALIVDKQYRTDAADGLVKQWATFDQHHPAVSIPQEEEVQTT